MSARGTSWSEEMNNASDDDDEDEDDETPSFKRMKTSDPVRPVNGGHSSPSRSREKSKERSEENSLYSQFSKQDKDKAERLLFNAIGAKHFELLKELLTLGVAIDIKNEEKATPLWLAIEEDCSLETIALLMTPSLIGTRYKQNLTPLHRAAMKGDHKLVLTMMNKMRDKDLPDILLTCEDDRIAQVKKQRDISGNSNWEIVNKKNKYGWTALHYAAESGSVGVLQVLLMEKECDVGVTTKLKQTAFHFAARKGHLLCIKLLFAAAECSKSLDSLPKSDKNGWNIACHASAQDDSEVIKWLSDHMSEYGADINSCNKKDSTPLLIACEYQKTETFKFLFSNSSEVTQETKDGRSVLHIAACHDSVEIVKMSLEDIPVDLQDQNGETALHVAYKWGSSRVQQLLLEYGANVTLTNNEGKKPADVAYEKFTIPKEIRKRGKAAIAKFVQDLRKGKVKMPRCKLMILGEAGVGKTSLLSLLTGEPFDPRHNETEGIDTDFVRTSNIYSDTWQKKAMEGNEEYKDVAAKQLAKILPDKEQRVKHQRKKVNVPSHSALQQQFESLVKKYTKHKVSSAPPKPQPTQPKQFHMNGRHQLATHHGHSLRVPPPYTSTPLPPPLSQNILFDRPLAHSHPPSVVTAEVPRTAKIIPTPPPVVTPSIPTHTTRREPMRREPTLPPSQPSHATPADPDVTQTEVMHRAVKLKKLKSSDNKIDLPLKFSSFDFAGQKHYKPMHHCFLTSRSVYVVAFNVRHLLDGQRDTCIQELKFWVNSIIIYTNDDAKIVLVGTHRGPYAGIHDNERLDPLTPEQEEAIHEVMQDNFDKCCYDSRIKWFEVTDRLEVTDRIITMVENSRRGDDSGADIIRKKLLKLGDQYPGNNDDLPTSYLRLEHKIFEERKQSSLISREDVVGWAREFGIDDPNVALTFFHDIGIIIDPSKLPTLFVAKDKSSVLEDMLLLSPQWLADVMKELMQIRRADDKYDATAVRRLHQEGIVDETILKDLWEKQLKEKFPLTTILIFLQAYGLIVPVGQQEPQQYYIPSQLPTTSKNMKKCTPHCNKVHISFDGFLPPFVLHHLMFKMYSESKKSKECCFLATEGFIESLHNCQWWVCHNNDDVIEVWIRTESSVRTILPAMQYLHQSLVIILKELKAVKYALGPVAECVSCKEQESLEYITYATDHQPIIANHLKCPNCAHPEAISITTTAVKSKAYTTNFKSFREEIKKLSKDIQKHLERKFKKRNKTEDEQLTFNDILDDWYERNKEDPWPGVVSALESYDGCDVDDIVKEMKQKNLFMCNHNE